MSSADSFWQPDSIRAAAGGGRWLRRPVEPPAVTPEWRGISTDSRTLARGQVFLALRGERFDGHDCLDQAVSRGAGMLIVQSSSAPLADAPPDLHVLLVDDTFKALTRLATAYRKRLAATHFIAVTGSTGKTTTKQLLASVLEQRYRVSASLKSFNNHIGVPLTVLAAQPPHQYVICEIGTNHPGEIASLASIVAPDIAVITGIGRVHLEGLGSIEGVAAEKAALLDGLASGGWAAVCIDEPAIEPHLERMQRGITFGCSEHADLRITECSVDDDGTSFTLSDRSRWRLPLLGRHHASNATAAIAVGRRCGIDDGAIQAGLLLVDPPAMRFVRQQIGPVTVYDDSYNANPESMRAALETFRRLGPPAARRIVILGDMLELGSFAPQAHRDVVTALLEVQPAWRSVDAVVLIGPEMAASARALSEAQPSLAFEHLPLLDDSAVGSIVDFIEPGDHVLIKASRGMRLERIVHALRQRFAAPAPLGNVPETAHPA